MDPTNYPKVSHSSSALPTMLKVAFNTGIVGHDLEFTSRGPTLGSLAAIDDDGTQHCVSLPWAVLSSTLKKLCDFPNLEWVGHAFLSVERPLLANTLRRSMIPLDLCHDTYIYHYLCNADFCKDSAKDEDSDDRSRGAGYLDLWSMASIYTSVPQWKACRGPSCVGPCPNHDAEGYNGLDALVPLLAMARLMPELQRRTSPNMKQHMYELAVICESMRELGVKVDPSVSEGLDAQIAAERAKLFEPSWEIPIGKKGQPLKPRKVWRAPFSPNSPKQVARWFEERGVILSKTGVIELRKALRSCPKGETRNWLEALISYKGVGKDTSAWLGEQYRDKENFIHPRWLYCGTSTGRLASSSPNFQNLIKRAGLGKTIKRALIPRDDDLRFVKADYKQLELRKALWNGGDDRDFGYDAFDWVVDQATEIFRTASRLSPDNKSPRDVAKRSVHAMNLHEGIRLIPTYELSDTYTRQMEDRGALRIYRDRPFEWHGQEHVVAYTGVNLAKTLFGKAGHRERRHALELQDSIQENFPALRKWHEQVTERAQKGYVKSRSGRWLTLRGSGEDAIKLTATMEMQGESADYVQEAMRLYYQREGMVPNMQVHDELVFEVPKTWDDKKCRDFIYQMEHESKFFPGFKCPIDAEVCDDNLYDGRELK